MACLSGSVSILCWHTTVPCLSRKLRQIAVRFDTERVCNVFRQFFTFNITVSIQCAHRVYRSKVAGRPSITARSQLSACSFRVARSGSLIC
jgi:hypothetical protein